MTDASTETPSDFKDRTVWLMVFGGFEVLLGLMAGGMGLLMLAMHFTMHQQGPGMGISVGFYGVVGVVFIWLGIGSILCRRWARALMLTCSSLGLVLGTVGFINVLAIQDIPQNFLTLQGHY